MTKATLEDALAEATKDGRVCPQPPKWQELYQMLPNRVQRGNGGWDPSLPLILGAWWETSDTDKSQRLREHLEWAARHEVIQQVLSFMRALAEEQWHHREE